MPPDTTIAVHAGEIGAHADERRVRVRLLPFGRTINYDGRRIMYDAGAVSVPDRLIPVNIDHGGGALERVGRITSTTVEHDAIYADLQLSDTTAGRDAYALLKDGVIDEVSAGVMLDPAREYIDNAGVAHWFGNLDHAALVGNSGFGNEGAAASRVLSVHDRNERKVSNMPPEVPTGTIEPPATPVAPAGDFASHADIERLERLIAEHGTPAPTAANTPRLFRDLSDFVNTQRAAASGNSNAQAKMAKHYAQVTPYVEGVAGAVAEHALEDDTTTTAAGLVPDYLSSEIIGRIDRRRPYVASIPSDPIGPYGMSVVYPKVVTKPDVDTQSAEKAEVTSQAMDIDPVSVDLVTYAGASDVSLQLVERSQPSFLNRLFDELAGVYAMRTDAAAVAHAVANAGDTAVLANFATDPAASWAAAVAGVAAVAADDGTNATSMVVATDRWAQLLGMVDSDGRPILSFGTGQNAQGSAALNSFNANWGGLNIIHDPHAATGTALIKSADATASLELAPQQLRAVQVGLLGLDVGVWGLFAHVVKYPDSLYTLTLA